MDATRSFGLTDVARMLDSVRSSREENHPETVHVLWRLIERSPPATALFDRLHARRDDGPALIELARLLIAVEDGEPHAQALYTARWLIEGSPAAVEQLARLEQMAVDAGFDDGDPDWLVKALDAREEVDRLLATLDDWQDAGDAIELDMQKDDAFRTLLRVCRARIARARGAKRKRLERLRRRLQDAARREIRITDTEAKVAELQGSLRSKLDPAAALETAERLIRHRRAE